MFRRDSIDSADGIYNFLDEGMIDDYVECYNQKAHDELKKKIVPEDLQSALFNCCEAALGKISDDSWVIDVGASYGFFINQLQAQNKIALDISREYLKQINDGIVKICCDAEDIPIIDDYCDVVICIDVIEHVKNVEALASEIRRILKPNGTLILACPWEQDLSVYDTEEYKKKYQKYKYTHLRSIDQETIERNFSDFEIVAWTMVRIGEKLMTIKPYPVRFMKLVSKKHRESED